MSENTKYAVGMFMWRREAHIANILQVIKRYNPTRLYLFFDGPRNLDDERAIETVKQLCSSTLNNVSFEVIVDALQEHGGLNKRFRTGLNRIFTEEPAAIILEDDTVPDITFFEYCSFYLTHFQNRNDIVAINGFYKYVPRFAHRFHPNTPFTNYIFNPWGWASWSHKFLPLYNPDIKSVSWWNAIRVFFLWKNFDLYRLRRRLLRDVETGKLHTWDVQLQWSLFLARKKVLTPHINLIQNVGNDSLASTFVAGASDFEQKAGNINNDAMILSVPHIPDYDLALCKSKRNLAYLKKLISR